MKITRSAPALVDLLRVKYSLPEWILFRELRDAAGFAGKRQADAVAMNLFPSRGCRVLGFEIKVSRSDWLRELKDPSKAEAFAPMLDEFYIVANDDVVERGELPATWGLLIPYGRGLRIKERSTLIQTAEFDRLFVASMLRKVSTVEMRRDHRERVALIEQGVELGKERAARDGQAEQSKILALNERIKKFEEAAGVSIDNYRAGDIGRAVKLVLESGSENYERQIANVSRQLKFIAGNLERLLDGNDDRSL